MKVTGRNILAVSTVATAVLVGAAPTEARPQASGAARAFERWTDVRPGVRHLVRREGPFGFHLVMVDLRAGGLRIAATDESVALPAEGHRGGHRWTRTSTWARRTGADLAINGNYYDLTRWRSACGLAVSNGQRWASTYDDRRLNCVASMGFGEGGRAMAFDSRGLRKRGEIAQWMSTVVSGSPALVRDGEVLRYSHPRHALYRNPRTAIGLSKDGATLFILVVDGREGSAQGMTCREAGRTLRSFGAWNAINLDGGGSSALYIAREGGVVNHTGEPERPVMNHLGFFFDDEERSANTEPASPASAEGATGAPARSAPERASGGGGLCGLPARRGGRWALARLEALDHRRMGHRMRSPSPTGPRFSCFLPLSA